MGAAKDPFRRALVVFCLQCCGSSFDGGAILQGQPSGLSLNVRAHRLRAVTGLLDTYRGRASDSAGFTLVLVVGARVDPVTRSHFYQDTVDLCISW